jgi:hypothetical protein
MSCGKGSLARNFHATGCGQRAVLTRVQDRYEVLIDDEAVESALEANIPLGGKSLAAAIQEYRDHISFVKKT